MESVVENALARDELVRTGVSYWPRRLTRTPREVLRGQPAQEVGDARKSWDVLKSLRFLEERRLQKGLIVDLGAFASEILCALHLAGFTNLVGVDLNPNVRRMPFAHDVRWTVGDMRRMPVEPGTAAAVTAISCIEHGYTPDPLFSEISRVLKVGGVFVGSMDYWQDKIDTSDIKLFNMEWTIFSASDVRDMFESAKRYGLFPCGDIQSTCKARCIDYAGRQYTFGWFALEKRA